MPVHIDITNEKYGSLTALKRVEDYISPKGYKKEKWLFKCDCGNFIVRNKDVVTKGECCSCGCEKQKRMIDYNKENKVKHNKRNTRLYRIWAGMKTRCFNKNDKTYIWYGKKGVSVCKEWIDDFMNFYKWSIQNGYKDNLTLDRINCFGNYEPENCRWVDVKTQCRNKRNNLKFTVNKEIKCLSEWAEIYNFNPKKERHKLLKNKNYLLTLIN